VAGIAHDVFVSYASDDKPTADAVCASLEARGIRAWIAPRDILPGSDWSEAIIDAIENARVMVLVFSARANASRQIIREVERAVSKGLTIIPLRIEDVVPGRNLEYFLGTPHWLDAMSPPLERHLTYLCETVEFLLERGERPEPLPLPQRTQYDVEWLKRNKVLAGIVAIPILLVAAFALGVIGGGGGGSATIDSRLVGSWLVTTGAEQSDGSTVDWTVTQKPDGAYASRTLVQDTGRANYDAVSGTLSLTPDDAPSGYFRSFDFEPDGDNLELLTFAVIPANLSFFLTTSGLAPNVLSTLEEWHRTASGTRPESGKWELNARYGSFEWQLTLSITSQGLYTFEATLNDTGTIRTTSDGSFTQVSKTAGIIEGHFEVVDRDTVIFKNGAVIANPLNAQVTWKRASSR